MFEVRQTKNTSICGITYPQENNIGKKRLQNSTSYRQLAFEIRERRPGFKVKVVPLVISALIGDIKKILKELKIYFKKIIYVKRLWQKCKELF